MKISHPSAVVRCTWPATDKNDNKITDKPSKKETMDLISQISKEYETPVIIELSKDAAKALKENLFQKENAKFNESYKKELKEKSSLLQTFLEPAQKLHQIIPNIQTNQKLEASLQGDRRKDNKCSLFDHTKSFFAVSGRKLIRERTAGTDLCRAGGSSISGRTAE